MDLKIYFIFLIPLITHSIIINAETWRHARDGIWFLLVADVSLISLSLSSSIEYYSLEFNAEKTLLFFILFLNI